MNQPNFSDMPCNPFMHDPDWRFTDPMSAIADRLLGEGCTSSARVDLILPLGCPFSIFLVAGHDEEGCAHASIVINRELAHSLAGNMEDGRVMEMPVHLFNAQPEGGEAKP
jgi:hypothetical protein